MAESLLNVFLETLGDLLIEEAKFLRNVKRDVHKVQGDLESIHDLLMKADRERHDSPTLESCIRNLEAMASKAENLLEKYAVEVQSKREEGRRSLKHKFQRYIRIICECNNIHEIGKEACDIISDMTKLTEDLNSELGKQNPSVLKQEAEQQRQWRRRTYGRDVVSHFVGMEEDIKILVSKMKDKEQQVVKIYGMGGLGKTTLASKVYNHTDLQSYARAWVCITQQFQPKAVFGDMLNQLDSSAQIDGMGDIQLVREIHRFLLGKKCMVVIDDIWNDSDWKSIKEAFPENCNMILTTRNENIANEESEAYKLDFLSEDDSWALLKKVANFLPDDKSFETVGRQIVSTCSRLPLSICVIGGILRQRHHTLPEWTKVHVKLNENTASYLMRGDGVIEDERVMQVLKLSYDALPYYLKPCFLYLASFPADELIETERLYLLWMAEGFISYQDKGPNETLRDVAQRYLAELGMRCMVQLHDADTYTPLNKFDSCEIHDLMHNLCSSKAKEKIFLELIDASKYPNNIPSSTSTSRSRFALSPSFGNSISRLAISYDPYSVSVIDGLKELKDLRSFMLLQKEFSFKPEISFNEGMINFEMSPYLRIFEVEGCEFEGEKLPSKVAELNHLRYLSLGSCNVRELPESVCSMSYLQTLDLRVSYVIRLPNMICKMKRLKHLFLEENIEVIGGEKLRLDGLKELETLDEITSETVCIANIPKLVNLRTVTVTVYDLGSMSIVVSNKISQLRETHIQVMSCDLSSEEGRGCLNDGLMSTSLVTLWIKECIMGGSFPNYKQEMCKNLATLVLYECTGKVDVMEFGKYPTLQDLRLERVDVEDTLICHPDSFPQLKRLHLRDLNDLRNWEVKKKAMPKLTYLWIAGCCNLKKVPDGLSFISTLQQMTIYRMPRELMKRVKEQDYGPFVNIDATFSDEES